MKEKIIIFIFAIVLFIPVYSQTVSENKSLSCATDEMTKELYKKYPERQKTSIALDSAIYEVIKNSSSTRGSRGIVYTIPVVIHIIHNNGPENISNATVLQGIQDLNEAFSNTGGYVDANGVDVEIQFCLAQRDPNNNTTNGITRDVNALTNMTMETDDLALKNINRWNPTQYLNIWLVSVINSIATGPGSVLGYAYFPSSHGNPEDGIVNNASYFGSTKSNSAVHVHEAGHYLGLHHTFNGGCVNNNCLLDGDQVCDTPPDNSTAVVACNGSVNTCTTDDDDLSTNNPFRPISNGGIGDQNDIFHDHMDYGDLPCHTLFTLGQKNRMRTALTTVRSSLLQSLGCSSPCTNPIVLSFNASATTVTVGTNVIFTNASIGTISNYNWSINNVTFATTQNSNYIFNTVGNFWVVLTENNADPNCKKQDSLLIKVQCNAQATFTPSATSINPGGQITFTNTSTGATTYQWYIDGIPQVSTQNFTHTFPTAGGFMIYLVACNANCCDTSNYQFIKVGMCGGKEANIWYFGKNAGLDFNSGNPVVLSNGMLNTSEGCSTISDKNGQLLFYTDGITVWNKNHQIMQNGFGLGGHISSAQSVLIVKQPGNNNMYYIFTTDVSCGYPPTGTTGALSYSIVDLNTNSGLGSIINKNIVLYTPTTEGVAAVKHANGTDVWIVSKNCFSNDIVSYLLTCTGISSSSVNSNVGNNITTNGIGTNIVISSNSKKMAIVESGLFQVRLCDFDKSSGVVSNPILLSAANYTYGAEFSPDAGKLYFSAFDQANDGQIFQVNLSAGLPSAIIASKTLIASSSTNKFMHMRQGPDGKIYIAQYYHPNLSVIMSPNALGGLCNFQINLININLGGLIESRIGLNNLLADYLSPKKAFKIQGDTSICNTFTYHVSTTTNCGLDKDSIGWILNGASTIVSTIDSSITIKPTQVGVDTLISIQYAACGVVTDTLLIHTKTGGPNINIGKDTVLCNAINLQLDAGAGYPNYLWSTTAATQTINVNNPGAYWVEITDMSGCKSTDTIKVIQGNTRPQVNLGADKLVCSGNVVVLDAGTGYMNYTWQDNSTSQTFTAWLPGMYWIMVEDSCGNISTDTIKVIQNLAGAFSFGNDTIICTGQSLILNPGNGFVNYAWSTTATSQTITTAATGNYWAAVIDSLGCQYADTINVLVMSSLPNVNLGNNKFICQGDTIMLNAGTGYQNYLWQNNSTNQTYTAISPGIYWISVQDSCGNISKDTVSIQLDNSAADIGTDTIICENESVVLNAGSGYLNYLWQDGSTNQKLTVNASGMYTIQVTSNNGCKYSDTIVVTVDDCTIHIQDCEIGIPDAFSPNGDGVNDELRVLGNCIDKITFVLYDRWGEKVFETTNPTQGWDGLHKGKKMDNAVFAYYLKITTFKGTEINLKGNISLIR